MHGGENVSQSIFFMNWMKYVFDYVLWTKREGASTKRASGRKSVLYHGNWE